MKIFLSFVLNLFILINAGVAYATPVSDTTTSVKKIATKQNTFSIGKMTRGEKNKPLISIKGKNINYGQDIRYLKNSVANKFPDSNLKIIGKIIYGDNLIIWDLPKKYKEIEIIGKASATKEQAVGLISLYNAELPIDATAEDIVDYYYVEASRENIKWDIALCQALVETGFFHFGGTVTPDQNNFCGLGTTSSVVKGAYFLTPQIGTRAHIQHLLAYISPKKPITEIVDPRYDLVRDIKAKTGYAKTWYDLNGKWAMGSEYAEKILDVHEQMRKIIIISGKGI